jgi:rSAM/selenodomain-associated transferase 2
VTLSIVIPTLNAAALLPAALACVAGAGETIVVDGGSTDHSAELARQAGARVIEAPRGRGEQMRAGAEEARGDFLLFLHADTLLAPQWRACAENFMRDPANGGKAAVFRFTLDDDSRAARRLERLVAWRGRVFGLPYGDQALLISRAFYESLGGFRPMPLMEDVDFIRRIGRRNIVVLEAEARTSAARWRHGGFFARSARNLLCLGLYFLGVPPEKIRKIYD